MSIALRGLHPDVRTAAELALSWGEFLGLKPRVTSAFRSLEQQRDLRARWEAGLSQFPANRAGDSAHNFGLAFDAVPQVDHVHISGQVFDADEVWRIVRELAGFRVPPNDRVHGEVPGWRQFR